MTTNEIQICIENKLSSYYGVTPQDASIEQMYKAVSLTVLDILMEKKKNFKLLSIKVFAFFYPKIWKNQLEYGIITDAARVVDFCYAFTQQE